MPSSGSSAFAVPAILPAVVLAGAFLLALPGPAAHAEPAVAGPSTPSAAAVPALQGHSPLVLHTAPGFSALPQLRSNPTRAQAPQTIHTGPWGAFNALDGSPAGFGAVARYGVVRWAEDWTALRDRRLRDDPFDPLKFIPLDANGTVYLTLSGESRERNWFESRPFLGQQKPDDSGRMTLRNLLGADLHLGSGFRAYAELVNGDAAGANAYGYTTTYRTRLDVQQAFVEGRTRLLGARAGIMLGRQEFLDAPNSVLYLRETPNLPLSWNGVRAYAVWPRVRLDGYDFVQTNTAPQQMLRDNENWGVRLFGGNASYAVPGFRVMGRPGTVFVDLFYIGYVLNGSAAAIAGATSTGTNSQNGATRRDNLGTRIWGRAGPIDFSIGGLHQGGRFRPATSGPARGVDAYSINGFAGWRFAALHGRPLVGVQADLFSGGNDTKRTGPVGTYLAPFNPQSSYLDTTTYVTEANLVNLAPVLEVAPSASTLLRVRVPVLWRASTNDAVYGTGRTYNFRDAHAGGFVGTVPQLNLGVRVTRHLSWTLDLARFLASRALERAGASDGTYLQSTVAFRF